ncbi:PP2C domain-containing protein [Cephalotus follicularis]|uniref:protein-serine/threonine phosphatase n=1 Tax=Cephalotus follicularis TaxID=3775 RepID=A0A1Q3B065_CEPFO|nr:PP2C domain-containing protein [Cephalotus follicularis]
MASSSSSSSSSKPMNSGSISAPIHSSGDTNPENTAVAVPVGYDTDGDDVRNKKGKEIASCVARHNRRVSWGFVMEQGMRGSMEDNVAVCPAFMHLSCSDFGGCTAPDCKYSGEISPLHFFAVYDGHGGDQVSNHCANGLHEILAEEWGREVIADGWNEKWELALRRAFEREDDILKDKNLAPYSVGSTAVVVILSPCQIIAANCGDSRAVLCRGKQAFPLTFDQKLERKDELARIITGGGKIVNWGCMRVEGILCMTRAIGDHDWKEWVISEPEVTFTTRSEEDECLILASDGLWDVMSNDDIVKYAHNELRRHRRLAKTGHISAHPAWHVSRQLLRKAFEAGSSDNIAVIVVDLKSPTIRHRHQL